MAGRVNINISTLYIMGKLTDKDIISAIEQGDEEKLAALLSSSKNAKLDQLLSDASNARNTLGNTLANTISKNTDIPNPMSDEDLPGYYKNLRDRFYPDAKSKLISDGKFLKSIQAEAAYRPNRNEIILADKLEEFNRSKGSPFHELKHDMDINSGYKVPTDVAGDGTWSKSGLVDEFGQELINKKGEITNVAEFEKAARKSGPAKLYEAITKGHHSIPFYEKEAIKRFLKKGTLPAIGSVLAKGAAGAATAGLSFASEASDSPEAGDSLGQESFDRESAEANRRMKAIKKDPRLAELYENIDKRAGANPAESIDPEMKMNALKQIRGLSAK